VERKVRCHMVEVSAVEIYWTAGLAGFSDPKNSCGKFSSLVGIG